MENVSEFSMAPLVEKPIYAVSDIQTHQADDGLHMTYTITNSGNTPSAPADRFRLPLTDPYGRTEKYTLEERYLHTASVGSIGIGESKTVNIPLSIPGEMFGRYGFVTVLACCYNKSGETPPSNYTMTLTARTEPLWKSGQCAPVRPPRSLPIPSRRASPSRAGTPPRPARRPATSRQR